MRLSATLALGLALALVASGCGGGQKRLTHSQLVVRMNGVCASAIEQIAATPPPGLSNLNQTALYIVHLKHVALYVLHEEQRIKPPVADEAIWRKEIAFHEGIIRVLDRLRAAALNGNRRALRRNYSLLKNFAHSPYEKRLGITGCS